ncbi:cobyric acid synthase [Sphingomonas sp. FW199]|uniref:cobyric acid synthase n=1 Tax=Sphingomonas sp. FW199 TaxID=3400217 RepID=UPI003CFAF435
MGAVMLQGTGSDVGKSVLVAGLCRLFANRGLTVRPFKPQNMSNNAAVASNPLGGPDGEIGRAQALQALACRTPPTTDMNPLLIKPQSDTGAQVVIHGRVAGELGAADYARRRDHWMDAILESWRRLTAQADLVIVEGAGSPAETNLRAGDVANMGFARAAGVPVVLVGDIDRGGVIASLVGTRAVLDPDDAAMIRGFLINKFRGDVRLFDAGYAEVSRRTGWPGLGVVPWLAAVRDLPAEDAVALDHADAASGGVTIAVPMLSRIANFDDFDPLANEPGVRLTMVPPGKPMPAEAAMIILPGTKATIADLGFLRAQGWDVDIAAHVRRGGMLMGICGGFQMLGQMIADPDGVEGPPETVAGLGYLPVVTHLTADKRVTDVTGTSIGDDAPFSGYEIHVGRTEPAGPVQPLLRLADGQTDGCISADGRIAGCYIHRLFDHPAQRAAWLARIGTASDGVLQSDRVERALDALAEQLAVHLNTEQLLAIARSMP